MKWIKKIIRLVDCYPNVSGVVFSFLCNCIMVGLLCYNPQIFIEAGIVKTIVCWGLVVCSLPFLFVCCGAAIALICWIIIRGIGVVVTGITLAWKKVVHWAYSD